MLPSAFPTASASRLRIFEAQLPSPSVPLFTLRRTPHDAPRKTRGRVVRYSFLVRLFHSLLHAGLSRRTGTCCRSTARLSWPLRDSRMRMGDMEESLPYPYLRDPFGKLDSL